MNSAGGRVAPLIAATTRRLQALQPNRPLKGLSRLSNLLSRWLPYQGIVTLPEGVRLELDSREPSQSWLLYAGSYQPALTHILRQRTPPGGHCLDIGANIGFYALTFAHWVGPAGRVAAFEANPALAERILRHVELNAFSHVEVVPRPVHSESGPLTFYIHPQAGKSSVNPGHVPRPLQTLVVEATTIDDYIRSRGWSRLDIIKMDIEGNDCRALLGARETLARFRPFVVFEYWYDTTEDAARPAFALLSGLGYTLRVLMPDGAQRPFDWRQAAPGKRHVDVLCFPPSAGARP